MKKKIIWIFAIIICICVTLYFCQETVTPNYEVVGGSMQKINIKGIELPNKNHGNYYLIVVKLKDANERRQLFVCIPADTRSPIPVIPVHSVGNLQYMWQS